MSAQTILAQVIINANLAAASAAQARADAALFDTKADIHSPAFTGVPTAPTADPNTNTTQIATTEYLDRLLAQPDGIATLDSSGMVPVAQLPALSFTHVYVVASQAAMLALPAVVGDLAVRTDIGETFVLSASPPSTLGNWTQLLFAAPVTSVAGLIGAIPASNLTAALNVFGGDSGSGGLQGLVPATVAGDGTHKFLKGSGGFVQPALADLSDASTIALLASPTFTGTPGGPTASVGTNTGQFATTAFVLAQGSSVGDGNPAMDGSASRGASTHYARADHVHPTDTSLAPLASPTLTGTPAAPTASPGTNTTQLATTAFVTAAASALVTGVSSFNSRTGAITPTTGDYTVSQVTGAAPLASPTLTGTPAAPTAAVDTNTTQLATAAFVLAQAASATPLMDGVAAVGTSTRFARADHVHPTDTTLAPLASPTFTGTPSAPTPGTKVNTTQIPTSAWVNTYFAPLASPSLTGTPSAPTAAVDTSNTQLATTAFVLGQASSSGDGTPAMDGTAARGTSTHYARADHVHPTDTSRAPLASPALTGTPTAPTAAPGTNTTQVATTAYADAISALKANIASPTFTGTPAAPTASPGNNTTQLATTAYVDAADALKANLASPTLTGTPAAPTATLGTNTTQIATTAFVQAALTGAGSITSVFGRTGAIVAVSGDYTYSQVTGAAPLASPTFTGTPAAPTASPGTNTTQLATTAFVTAAVAATPVPTEASDANMWAETSTTTFVSPRRTGTAKAWIALTDASTIAVDSTTGRNFKVTLGGKRTVGVPTGTRVEGDEYKFLFKQDATGSRTITWASGYKVDGDTAFAIGTTASKYSLVTGVVLPGAAMIFVQLVAVNFTGP